MGFGWDALGAVAGVVAAVPVVGVGLRGVLRRPARLPPPDPGPERPGGTSVAPPTGALPRRLLGRAAERRALRRRGGAVIVLAGLGGQGKTTLAADLAERWRRGRRRDVWWVSAADETTLRAGLVTVARRLGASPATERALAGGAPDAPDLLWALLDRAPRRWLLVFDNADVPSLLAARPGAAPGDGTGLPRASRRGLTVVTTRDDSAETWGRHARVLRIGPLDEDDAVRLLRDLAPRAGSDDEARALARRLGRLPLALQLAGRYLGSPAPRWSTFAAYRRALDDGAGLTRLSGGDDPRSAAMWTWEITLDHLASSGHPEVRPLLRILSCCAAATPVPRSALFAVRLDVPPDEADRRVEAGVELLRRYGLVEVGDAAVLVHPLVADASRAHLPGEDWAGTWRAAVGLVVRTLDGLDPLSPADWPRYVATEPHLHALVATMPDGLDAPGDLLEIARATGEALRLSGAVAPGERLCAAVLGRAGDLDEVRFRLEHERVRAVGLQGRWSEARDAARALLDDGAGLLGRDHPDVLALRHDLAWVTAMLGDFAAAERIFRAVLAGRERRLPPDHPDTLRTWNEVAWVAGCQGRWAEAEQGYREVLRERRRVLGDRDPEVLITEHELAWTIANQERFAEAEEAHRVILERRREMLGPDHPRTLGSRHELAWLALRQGRPREAEAQYRDLLADLRRVLGDHHPDTLVAAYERALALAARGRREALAALADVAAARERACGADHPDTRATAKAIRDLQDGRDPDPPRHLS
ncbi:tetratricopeptide repeat protein [Actinomadura rayongensis]|uniref:Tetratricopeptide repeat protein n=1 Tax=Actinomadura rayongensis TaxID=1429076 RepID=A0A6I4W0D3_9ACTN|nr:tetratricopeptide repeat protein [Actinomadura rayongensis]MXQ64039.1 tetratricopeptide repeat protein [Actinomadura rayongensis]